MILAGNFEDFMRLLKARKVDYMVVGAMPLPRHTGGAVLQYRQARFWTALLGM